ncbi:MAG: aminotransferase class V-fold PLP-dependent enzyme [Ignavibacteria bacterium]
MLENHTYIREQFPFLKKFIYFDAAHYTPYPQVVVKELNEFMKRYTEDYLNLSLFNMDITREMKSTCAKMINADPDDIIITSSTTHGINIFANGINLPPDDNNVAFLDSEFPAVVYPWLNQQDLGRVSVVMIPSSKGYTNETVIKKSLLDYNVRVLTISYVQFLGYRYNIKSIAEFCRKNNIFLVVDAIQAAGICPIDVVDMGIDYICTGNQKWLMSPAGTGFTYISKKYKEFVHPSYAATSSINYDFENFLSYKLDFKNDGAAYENSTLNTLGMIGMNEVMKLFMELGVENIFRHILDIQDHFIELLDKTMYRVESDLNPEHRSNIMIFSRSDQSLNKHIQKALESKNIYIAIREGYLRLAPHIYNNYEDVEILARELNSM